MRIYNLLNKKNNNQENDAKKSKLGMAMKAGLLATTFVFALTGCGSKHSGYTSDSLQSDGMYMNSTSSGYSSNKTDYAYDDYDTDSAISYEEDYYDDVASESTGSSSGLDTIREENKGAKLIRTVYLSIDTEKFDDSVKLVEDRVNTLGGYIESSELYDYSSGRDQTIIIRIPYDKVDLFLDGIDTYGTIGHKSDNTEDITLKYADTESRIESLETQHKRLLELLEQAESLEDIIVLNDHLTEIEWELDSYKRQIRDYDNLVSYSTITIEINEKAYIAPVEDDTLWSRITSGFSNTLHNLGVFFSDLLVWLIVSSPVFVILAIIVILHIVIIKAIIKACKKKNAKKRAAAAKTAELAKEAEELAKEVSEEAKKEASEEKNSDE